jgi:hypothetical protein
MNKVPEDRPSRRYIGAFFACNNLIGEERINVSRMRHSWEHHVTINKNKVPQDGQRLPRHFAPRETQLVQRLSGSSFAAIHSSLLALQFSDGDERVMLAA